MHNKLATLFLARTTDLDRSAMHLNQTLHKRQTNTQSTLRSVGAAIYLHEHIEDAVELIRRYTSAVIANRYRHYVVAISPGTQRDRTVSSSVFATVIEQVPKHLGQPRLVGVQVDRFVRKIDR